MRTTVLASLAGCAVLSLSAPAASQNLFADPLYGTLTLSGGFTPDPASVQVQAGGPDSATPLGPGCEGYINNSAPDVRLEFQPGERPLFLYVEAETDTTLAVNLPNGQWVCNDDSQGLNPGLVVQPAMPGQYDIWVGTFEQIGTAPATLFVSEISGHQGGAVVGGVDAGSDWGAGGGYGEGSAGAPDIMAAPLFGTLDLSGGFTPDPATVEVEAGGSDMADGLGPNCTGYINNAAPDVRLNFEAGQLPLFIYAQSEVDTTLVVNLPDGRWMCNDDSSGLNPGITVEPAASGQYDIWIGTFEETEPAPATLFISELSGG